MTLDLSQLPPEQRTFLKAHPDLLRSLERAIPVQAGRLKRKREARSKLQRELEDFDRRSREITRYDPQLTRIQQKWMDAAGVDRGKKGLVCPVCGSPNGAYADGGKPNKKNGEPWCLKCDSPLIPEGKLERWKRAPKVRMLPKSLREEVKKLHKGLYPEGARKR